MVIGWHSYCKDLERTFTTLVSSLGLRVEVSLPDRIKNIILFTTRCCLVVVVVVGFYKIIPFLCFFKIIQGLNTNPNLSFDSKCPVSPGFMFKNHHTVDPAKQYKPLNKTYISCVQTDGLGLGAWTKPGRCTYFVF